MQYACMHVRAIVPYSFEFRVRHAAYPGAHIYTTADTSVTRSAVQTVVLNVMHPFQPVNRIDWASAFEPPFCGSRGSVFSTPRVC
jgi:hypothetical protein